MTENATILPYDRSLNREGLVVDQSENFYRVITPPLRSWRLLGFGWWLGIGFLAFYTLGPVSIILLAPKADWIAGMVCSAPYAFLLAFTIFAAINKLNRRYIFEITADSFTLKRTEIARRTQSQIYRRDAITGIHASAERGHLIVHARGEDMIDLQIAKDRELVERAVTALTTGMQVRMSSTSRTHDAETDRRETEATATRRRALLITTFAIVGLGVILAVAIHPMMLLPMVFGASVPAGLAMGTQEKEYYMF
jgi:hypothetical protein